MEFGFSAKQKWFDIKDFRRNMIHIIVVHYRYTYARPLPQALPISS